VAYTISVVSVSSTGDSTATGPSNVVTPAAPPIPPTPPDTTLVLTTDKGVITHAEPKQRIVVIGTGFAAFSTATIVIYSHPIELGTVVTDAYGNFSKPVTIPADLANGHHSLVAAGVAPDGSTHAMKMGVDVATSSLAATGTSLVDYLILGLLLLVTGAGLANWGRRRYRDRT
jgi:titin